jgi:sugar O-acyltransferase (sialic acid O-acetyltransferase NeuD family)
MQSKGSIILIGYSGHAFVAYDIFQSQSLTVEAYCDVEEKTYNPLNLSYLGVESQAVLAGHPYFIAVGDNMRRHQIYVLLKSQGLHKPTNAIHAQAVVSSLSQLGAGVMVSAGAVVNAFARIGDGVILNTNCVVEHECEVGDFTHICPSAILCGNVVIGEKSFIGAGSVIKQGVRIGNGVVIGAGSVILNDVADGMVMVGNPQRMLIRDASRVEAQQKNQDK